VAAALKLPRPLHALRMLQLSPTTARALAAAVAAPVPARWEETGRAGPRHRSEEAPREATPAEGSWGTGSCATARGDGRAGSRCRSEEAPREGTPAAAASSASRLASAAAVAPRRARPPPLGRPPREAGELGGRAATVRRCCAGGVGGESEGGWQMVAGPIEERG